MKVAPSGFVRNVARYPFRHLPDPLATAHFQRCVDIRPARFAVGMDPFQSQVPDPHAHSCQRVHELRFVGRVEEVSSAGMVTAIVWEKPSGRESIATLNVDEHLAGARPQSGDLLQIMTWIDLVDGGKVPRVQVTRESKFLDDTERDRLRGMLGRWKEVHG